MLALAAFATSEAVLADEPLAPPPVTVCSLAGGACATRDPASCTATVWRKGPHDARVAVWRARITSSALQVSDDGRALVEIYPGLNLLNPDAGPSTNMLVFHRPGQVPVRVKLSDVVARPAVLPKTVSHRQWARAYGFDGRGSFVLDTVEGRHLLFDPATGRRRS